MSVDLPLWPAPPVQEPASGEPAERASLYRAYRSFTFAEVAGQQHVTQTLRNAVRYGKVAHAYLFTGPRGTGKTSTARILARALNCLQPQDGEPCNACTVCSAMLERRSLDLVEIDGASNNSVDDVRELRDRVNFRPASARRKVFIIDEVHMLSIGAFNALLKTLEEPPDHVLFALATTELQKVPATVTSRCQIFHLRPIPAPEMVERLRYVCSHEGIQADDQVLAFVTQQSTGSLRDALSLLEQIRAFCGDILQLAEVEAALGIARAGQISALANAMAAGDLGAALLEVGDLIDGGIDPRQLTRQLSGYWRDALVGRARKHLVPEVQVARLRGEQIFAVLRSLLQVESVTRRSDSPRWALELAIAEATLALGDGSFLSVVDHPPVATVAKPNAPMVAPAADTYIPPEPAEWLAPLVVTPPVPIPGTPAVIDAEPPLAGLLPARPEPPVLEPSELDRSSQGSLHLPRLDSAAAQERWPAVLRWLKEQGKRNIAAYLEQTSSAALRTEGTVLTIGFPATASLVRAQVEKASNRTVLEQAVGATFGGQWSVRCVTIEGMATPPTLDYMDGLAAEFEGRGRHRLHDDHGGH